MALQGNLPIGSAILPGTYWRVQEFWWEYGKGSQIFCRVHTYPTAQDAEFIQHPAEYEEKTYPTGEIDPTLPDDDPNRYLTETVRVKVSDRKGHPPQSLNSLSRIDSRSPRSALLKFGLNCLNCD